MNHPTFREFYHAVYGYPPFKWQERLADEVLQAGWTGLVLDLPTGAGKTSALDIAVYCLACAPQRMPRRTVLVVDRRVVVDQAGEHARKLGQALDTATDGPAFQIAELLRDLTGETEHHSCIAVALMRGGMPRDNDWARTPDVPVLGVSTVDQVGSRLLFRGYGVSGKSASIHAGLMGNDTLILLDEVHLAVPFAQTLHSIETQFRRKVQGLPHRFAVVPMSATVSEQPDHVRPFRLQAIERAEPLLHRRLSAHKITHLREVKVSGPEKQRCRQLAERAVAEALNLQRQGAGTVGIVVNRLETARWAANQLQREHAEKTSFHLVTGRMRAIERDPLTSELMTRVGAGRIRASSDQPLIVVATQCIEAGADLDFDGLVTECAALDALRQRFGRVDRRGDLGESHSVLLGRSDAVALGAEDAVYDKALSRTWAWLQSVADERKVDFGVDHLPEPNVEELSGPRPDAPVLLPAHLDAWVQTSTKILADPDPALWMHGPARTLGDVQVVWREGIKPDVAPGPLFEALEAVRPSSLESVSLPVVAARYWLSGNAVPPISDVLAERLDEQDQRTDATGLVYRWTGDRKTSEWVTPQRIRPGDVLVLDSSHGGLTLGTFDPDSRHPVVDYGDLAQLRGRGLATIRVQGNQAASGWGALSSVPDPEPDETVRQMKRRFRDWVRSWPEAPPEGFIGGPVEWSQVRSALWAGAELNRLSSKLLVISKPIPRERNKIDFHLTDQVSESDESSFARLPVTLARHCSDVRTIVGRFATKLGFAETLAHDLALAAWLHDVGKADERFQRWLVGGDGVRVALQEEVLAKSELPPTSSVEREEARRRAGYPGGYRHELLSVEMLHSSQALATANDPELILHLIASHHGWCRPAAPPMDDPGELSVKLSHGGIDLTGNTRHGLARLDSGISQRFWNLTERYGWWELAWLESVLRLADHNASAEGDC